jgi:hypothetical protein
MQPLSSKEANHGSRKRREMKRKKKEEKKRKEKKRKEKTRLGQPTSQPTYPCPSSLVSLPPSSSAAATHSLSSSISLPPSLCPVDTAAAAVAGALRWSRRRTWGCGWWSREERGGGEWR